ncbi:hypothetical protein Nepgr_018253 [Nepenthes gracilis]|uniref:DUF7026 domain-containing protein n=1 Tax=Nepenthes gracilis TaxID=150966 RepID=A0AAD3STR4_NEPGR|nr:hypothetical protein Nepgr_018253 [Nepenthes gracilis]
MAQIRVVPLPFNVHPQPPKLCTSPFLLPKATNKIIISCSRKSDISDAVLASELAREVGKINIQFLEREDAMKKSKQLLFGELCHYLNLKPEEVKKRWMKTMSEDEKWGLIRGFVFDWGVNFHPLSARCVKDLVEEHLGEDGSASNPDSAVIFLAGLWKLMGLSPNKP